MFSGVEFGARMITIDGKQIKLQIWDTVNITDVCVVCLAGVFYFFAVLGLCLLSCGGNPNIKNLLQCI